MTKPNQRAHSPFDSPRLAERVLVVGDLQRVVDAAQLLENPTEIWNTREYRAFSGEYQGKAITICSHGVGAGGAAYIFENLFRAGAKTILRAGTCGAMIPEAEPGALVIGTGAVRADGVSQYMLPMEFPALAHHETIYALQQAAQAYAVEQLYNGIILTSATFFEYPATPDHSEAYRQSGVVAVEMEFAVLLILAAIHGARAGGIFTVDSNLLHRRDSSDYQPDQSVVAEGKRLMLEIALDALVRLE